MASPKIQESCEFSLTSEMLGCILQELREIDRPYLLGIHLKIDSTILRRIEKENKDDLERQKADVIDHWLRNEASDRSWGRLAEAVRRLGGHDQLVLQLEKLKSDYLPKTESNQPGASDGSIRSNENSEDSERSINQSISLDVCVNRSVHNIPPARYDSRPEPAELREHVRKHVLDKWEELADELGLDDDDSVSGELEKIREKWKTDRKKAAFEVLKLWLKHYKATATWRKLIIALEKVPGLQEATKSINDFLSSCQHSPATSGTMQTMQNPETMDVNTSQDSALSLSSSQSSYHSTKKHYETCMKPREYQKELARPGISGQNYIICAPTNSGKTLVVAMIIANHLEEKSQMLQQKTKVVYIVQTLALAEQQTQVLSDYICGAHVVRRTGNRTHIRDPRLQMHIKDALLDNETDIIVCTAGKLLDELKREVISLRQVSLMIVDECHSMECSKQFSNAAPAQIMRNYLELKYAEVAGEGQLPQIVGLTATPGMGKNPRLDAATVVDYLIMLCAHMDATGGIQTVQEKENKKELSKYVHTPVSYFDRIEQSDRKEIQRIEREMQECERFLGFSSQFRCWSQQYEHAVKQRRKELDGSYDPNDRDKVSTVRLLEHYSQTLIKYIELPCAQATDHLKKYNDLTRQRPDKLSDRENHLLERFEQLNDDIKSLDLSENPILKKLELRLTDAFQQKRGSSGIVFVRTREQAEAICKWISDSELAKSAGVEALMLVGHGGGKGSGMPDEKQKQVLTEFREGRCNLLVATSVAEEGLDIKQCNLIVRLHISSARAQAQTTGRARAEDSETVTIVADDPKKAFKDFINNEHIELTNYVIENNHLPSPQQLQEEITRRQKMIIENARKQKILEKERRERHPAQNVEVKCSRCKTSACRGSDIYRLDNATGNHHIVPGEEFAALYEKIKHHTPGVVLGCDDPIIKKDYKIHCLNCNQSWGILGTWPSGIELPIISRDGFSFFINGSNREDGFTKWKDRPFDVLLFSEWLTKSSPPATSDQ